MSELTLTWSENGQFHQHTLTETQSSKHFASYRLGRDPAQCDLVLHDLSVSALHVEIVLNSPPQQTIIRNLRASNPPLVDGIQLTIGEAPLYQGSRINLGRVELTVAHLILGNIHLAQSSPPPAHPTANREYGLSCPNPNCGKISAYNTAILQQGCPWCGFSLAAANSVVILPPNA
jgi:hypothetical protein